MRLWAGVKKAEDEVEGGCAVQVEGIEGEGAGDQDAQRNG
jgi:hypothetical protein